jgi:Tol biopolymer transport system component
MPGEDVSNPTWSPDGGTIAYVRNGQAAADGIYVVRADGGDAPRRVLKTSDSARRFLAPGTFTPDGGSLVAVDFAEGKGDLVLVPIAPATGDAVEKIKPLVTGPGFEVSPCFAPGGAWLAWSSDESGKSEIYVGAVRRDGTVGAPVPVSQGGGARPEWSADGRTLYFVTPDERIMAAPFDLHTGAAMPSKLHLDLAAVRPVRPTDYAQVLPDGRVFVIQKGDDEAEVRRIDLVLNWTRELRGR